MKNIFSLLLLGAMALSASAAIYSFSYFKKLVVTAATPVRLSTTHIYASTVTVQSMLTNTGKIYIQAASAATTNRLQLEPGQTITMTMTGPKKEDHLDLYTIYVDASVSNEGVAVGYLPHR